jgi:pre-mRNA-processing factor 19
MLEAYELRAQLKKCRKELAHSLYQHDAACRIIARLQQEKESAEQALQNLKSQLVEATQRAQAAEADVEDGRAAKRVCPPLFDHDRHFWLLPTLLFAFA